MAKRNEKSKLSGAEQFEKYYLELYSSRWEELKKSALKADRKIYRYVKDLPSSVDFDLPKFLPEILAKKFFADCTEIRPQEGNDLDFYYLDFASVLAARFLEARTEHLVLDMCAAPGGKSLVLASDMNFKGEIICNELSRGRRDRLKRVLREGLGDLLNEQRLDLKVKGLDGVKFGIKYPKTFDRILIDAPCSGERHLLKRPSELENWSKKRSQKLSQRQYGLLCSGLLALRPGGRILYSTCSLSEIENDGVVRKFLAKKGEFARIFDYEKHQMMELIHSVDFIERTEFGFQILPDKAHGMGPIYFCLIESVV